MQIISKLSDMIGEELNDAEKYVRCALENKEYFPSLAKTFLGQMGRWVGWTPSGTQTAAAA